MEVLGMPVIEITIVINLVWRTVESDKSVLVKLEAGFSSLSYHPNQG